MRLLVAEWIKVKGDLLRYPFELITAILGSLFFYLFIFNMGLGSQFGAGGDYLVYTIFVWDLTMICATIVMHNFLSQCSQGVIEQVYLAKSSFFLVLLSSCIGSTCCMMR